MNRNSDCHSGSGLPNPEFSKTLLRFRLNRSRIFNVSGIRPDIPVPSRAYPRGPEATIKPHAIETLECIIAIDNYFYATASRIYT